jgi:SWI/SNF-related matrix-associated actin-dependent regulator of chromatin subfamily A-like protein 1
VENTAVAISIEINDYLRKEGLMLRKTKKQVLKELSEKRRVVQTIDFDKGTYAQHFSRD